MFTLKVKSIDVSVLGLIGLLPGFLFFFFLEVSGLFHSCRQSPVFPSNMWQSSKNKLLSKEMRLYHHLLSQSFMFYVLCQKGIYTHAQTHYSSFVKGRWVDRPSGIERKEWGGGGVKKGSCNRGFRLYLTYSSFGICWCASSQPS